MKKEEFKKFVEEYPIFLDGATGSNLQKRGMPFGVCPEKWITENEDIFIELQREYISSGSQILYAPTFGANSIKLKEYSLENEAARLNKRLVEISKKAADGRALVAGDITMCGQTLEPLGELLFEDLIASYKEQISSIYEAGADLLVVETMMSLKETRAAIIASKEVCDLPIMVTMTFGEGGKTLYGTDAKTAAAVLDAMGVDAVGMNCSAGPDKMLPLISQMREVTNLPIIAKPNAGMPVLGDDGHTHYDMDASEFAIYMNKIANEGAKLLGGCCGTTPEFISSIRNNTTKTEVENIKKEDSIFISSDRELLNISDVEFCKIDISKDEDLREELENEEYDLLYDLLDEMEEEDQNAVYICVDSSDDRLNLIAKLLPELTGYCSSPICIEADDTSVLEYVLRNYCGIVGVKIKSANKAEAVKLIKKYGAVEL